MTPQYPGHKLESYSGTPAAPSMWATTTRAIARRARRLRGLGDLNEWSFGLWCLAATRADEIDSGDGHLKRLESWLNPLIDADGNWKTPQRNSDQFLKGYALLHVAKCRQQDKWLSAGRSLATMLAEIGDNAVEGSIPYTNDTSLVLVDTLGMICPFLARAGLMFDEPAIVDMAVLQIQNFARNALDPNTALPYHGYYAGGPSRLGPWGWGRGTGWMLIGIVDTLIDLPADHASAPELKALLNRVVESLIEFQKQDGHWSWVLPMTDTKSDASATAFIAYAIARARQHDLIGHELNGLLTRALSALAKSRLENGIYTGGSGECLGVNGYARDFRPSHWLQAMSETCLLITDTERYEEEEVSAKPVKLNHLQSSRTRQEH